MFYPVRTHISVRLGAFSAWAVLLSVTSSLSLVPAERAFQPPTAYRRVALTFDDGPRPLSTQKMIDLLRAQRVRATFFVVGVMAAKNPDLIVSMAADGHEIAGHSWSHRAIHKMSRADIKMELDLTRLLIERLTGQSHWIFRAPGGTEAFLRERLWFPRDYTMVMWDLHSQDHTGLSGPDIASLIDGRVKDGDIILMHNGLDTTMQALRVLIPKLREQGFEFVTVSTLLKDRSNT